MNALDMALSEVEDMTYGLDFTVDIMMPSGGPLRRKLQQIKGARAWRRRKRNKSRARTHLRRFKQNHPGYFLDYSRQWRLNNPDLLRGQRERWNQKRRVKRQNKRLAEGS